MFDAFYAHVGSFRKMKYLHLKMRHINYGFAALEHRCRVLGGPPVVVEDDKKIDLSRLRIDVFGVGYTSDRGPKRENRQSSRFNGKNRETVSSGAAIQQV